MQFEQPLTVDAYYNALVPDFQESWFSGILTAELQYVTAMKPLTTCKDWHFGEQSRYNQWSTIFHK